MTTTTQTTEQLTWIVTGATRGFGRAIAEHALARGDRVTAAVRRPDALVELGDRYPGTLAIVEFDARDSAAGSRVVDAALGRFGRLDVLVNNAGRGVIGAAEEVGDATLREAMDLHLFTPAALTRAALPSMRRQGSGLVVQMSSQGGRMSFPGVGAYSAGKFALEGWSEALAGEVAPFGVRVMIVEPSRFRTAFNEPDALSIADIDPAYRDVLAAVRADMIAAAGVQEGDPERAAEVIVDLAHGGDVPLRLPLGTEAVQRIGDSYRRDLALLETHADTARSVDFPDAQPPDRPIPP